MQRCSSHVCLLPALLVTPQQHILLSSAVRRAKFRLNASNRTEAFCTLEGLPSDMTIRGEVNHNRCVCSFH